MKLMVSLIRQLQLIGIKTNLESFAITILMEHMLTRNQLPLFLWVSKQWGINSAGNNGSEGESGWYAFPVNFNSACFALFCGLRNTDTNKPTNYDSEVQPRNWTTTKFNVYKQNYGGNPWFGSFILFAIGR